MPKTARTVESAGGDATQPLPRPFRKQRFTVFLITGDDALWPLIGADLSGDLILKQLDSVEELLATVPAGQAGIVLWDARKTGEAATLATLAQHSTRFALIVLDSSNKAGVWTLPLQQRQIVANVGLPLSSVILGKALENAREEVNARVALLGESSTASAAPADAAKKPRWLPVALGGAIIAAAAVVFVVSRHSATPNERMPEVNAKGAAPLAKPTPSTAEVTVAGAAPAADEKLDALIEKAQQAMLDRHFIDPTAGSALAIYRDVLLMDPGNGEARQGMQRLAEILISRVQSALDERKFDVALQSLETARSIDANDRRLPALDDRITTLRAELGPAQINAAMNAQNFDRASQLIDDAARAKSLPPAKLALLREDVRKHRDEFESARLLKLVETRLQQDKLVEPRGDSAAFYLEQAKQAGEPPATLQPLYQELQRQLATDARAAVDSKHFGDAEYALQEMRSLGASASTIAGLQKDLTAARGAAAPVKAEQPQYLDLAQSRLAQGKVLEPDNDNALYYLNQLRSADPKNAALPQLSGDVQGHILERARIALDSGDTGRTDDLLQQAATLGASPALDAMNDKRRQMTASSGPSQVTEESLTRLSKLEIIYPNRAVLAGIEGWVEIQFTVNPDGTVSNVKVLNSSPARTFEQAATKAVSKMRYQPVIKDGKAVAVDAKFRVAFRIPK